MSQSEVFRPQNGPLLLRGNLSDGMPIPTDTFRKPSSRPNSRPATQGSNSGYRFGNLSHNQFFARHNPHPARVRHLKGLLDVPICAVNDSGYFANPRYSLQFPPDNYDEKKMASSRIPVNAINVNSQLHPINTITGLQYFMGKPLNSRIFREKAIPKVGMVPVTEAWRDELRALTEAINTASGEPKNAPAPREEERRPKTQYSTETGRLIPPPSRAMSRGVSRGATRDKMMGQFQHIMEEPDTESMILQMLCQVLQTDDVNAVQSWLVSAGDREKSLVMDMIKSALVSSEQYYNHNPDRPATGAFAEDFQAPAPGSMLPAISEANKPGTAVSVDRLSFEPMPRPSSQQAAMDGKYMRYTYSPMTGEQRKVATPLLDETKPPVTPQDVFRPSSRVGSAAGPKLRLTRTPNQEQTITWQPDQSVPNV